MTAALATPPGRLPAAGRGARRPGWPDAGVWRHTWTALALSTVARGLLGTLTGMFLWSVAPVALGWESSVVVSGSMAPTLEVGDVVLTRPVGEDDLVPGQVLLVDDPDHPGRLRLHRLVEVTDGGLVLRGDANPQTDTTPVEATAVHGVGALRVPALGGPLVWLREHRAGPLLATGAGLAGLVAAALLHRPFETPADPGRPARGRHRAPARRRLPLVATVAVGTTGAVALAVLAPGWAAYAATTVGSSGTLSSATYHSCGNAARDVGVAGATGTAGADRWYALRETTGTTAADGAGTADNGTYQGGVTLGTTGGPCPRDGALAARFDGVDDFVSTAATVTATTSLSLEVWFRTTTTTGGVLLTLASSATGASSATDRLLYMANDGRLYFGLQPGNNAFRAISSPAAYNNGAWHLATVTMTSGATATGSRLYVDGVLVASDATMTTARTTSGHPRIGYDQLSKDAWPVRPTSNHFAGSLASAAFYPGVVLTAAQIADHDTAGR